MAIWARAHYLQGVTFCLPLILIQIWLCENGLDSKTPFQTSSDQHRHHSSHWPELPTIPLLPILLTLIHWGGGGHWGGEASQSPVAGVSWVFSVCHCNITAFKDLKELEIQRFEYSEVGYRHWHALWKLHVLSKHFFTFNNRYLVHYRCISPS